DEVRKSAQRAADLTRQLLMFSRRSVLKIEVIDLNELVANLIKMLGRLLEERIALAFERGAVLPAIEADTGMMEQVLVNLVVNARDALPQGGRIAIATATHEGDSNRAPADVAGNARKQFVCLSVSDTGCGMDAATRERVFEPFFTTKAAGMGTGLGLATVYGIVAQHGGWVEVESKVGAGTTFRVYFPASQKRAQIQRPEKEPRVLKGSGTLLVVEDDPSVRRMLVLSLRTLGYRIFDASNGPAALDVWHQHGPEIELLLTDMVMPEGMTGLELAEQLRRERPSLPVIIASGYSSEMSQLGKPTIEGIDYLAKPFDVSVLGVTVRRSLERSRRSINSR
ncbi:MAG: response regulator, partial [Verrucomicrobia bacterium]|nr:response regulator [Verrucomicrobiota bacterium]